MHFRAICDFTSKLNEELANIGSCRQCMLHECHLCCCLYMCITPLKTLFKCPPFIYMFFVYFSTQKLLVIFPRAVSWIQNLQSFGSVKMMSIVAKCVSRLYLTFDWLNFYKHNWDSNLELSECVGNFGLYQAEFWINLLKKEMKMKCKKVIDWLYFYRLNLGGGGGPIRIMAA